MSLPDVKVKILLSGDRDFLVGLADELPSENLREKLLNYLNDRSGERLLCGAFLKDRLVAVSALYFIPRLPWASLVYLKSVHSLAVSEKLSVLSVLVDFSFEQMENKNCVRVFMANEMKRRGTFMNAKLYPLVKKIPRLQKYSFISEDFVRAGEKPRFEFQWLLMGSEISKVDLGFVSATRMK